MDFFGPAHEMPTLILYALFHHDRGGENESILGRMIGGYNFFKCWVKGHHIKKNYIKKLFTYN